MTKRQPPLLLLLVLAQFGSMALGVVWAAGWLQGAFDAVIHRNVVSAGESLASEVARKADELPPASVVPGGEGWEKLQAVCRQTSVPLNGFVAVMRSDTGALAADSRLDGDPTLLGSFPGRELVVTPTEVRSVVELAAAAEAKSQPIVSGDIDLGGDLYCASFLQLSKLKAVVGVFQPAASVDLAVAELLTPLVRVGLLLATAVVGASALLTALLVTRYQRATTEARQGLEGEVQTRTQSLVKTRDAMAFGLAQLAESRDKNSGQHLERMRAYVTLLASELAKTNPEIDRAYVAKLAAASTLHDIGKVGVPDVILQKTDGLSTSERRAMQLHASIGGQCLAAIEAQLEGDDFLTVARETAESHHEQWDGSGYPHGLQGKAIPLPARIVALADVYDALTTDRTYRPAISHVEARDWIISRYGTHFDPEVVEAFAAREKEFMKVSQTSGWAARRAPQPDPDRSGPLAPPQVPAEAG